MPTTRPAGAQTSLGRYAILTFDMGTCARRCVRQINQTDAAGLTVALRLSEVGDYGGDGDDEFRVAREREEIHGTLTQVVDSYDAESCVLKSTQTTSLPILF